MFFYLFEIQSRAAILCGFFLFFCDCRIFCRNPDMWHKFKDRDLRCGNNLTKLVELRWCKRACILKNGIIWNIIIIANQFQSVKIGTMWFLIIYFHSVVFLTGTKFYANAEHWRKESTGILDGIEQFCNNLFGKNCWRRLFAKNHGRDFKTWIKVIGGMKGQAKAIVNNTNLCWLI